MGTLAVLTVLSGCSQAQKPPVQQIMPAPAVSSVPEGIQQAAEQVAFRAVQLAFPQVDATPAANCVRTNATNDELFILADGTLHSTTPAEQAMVTQILQRPQTNQCVADNGQSLNL